MVFDLCIRLRQGEDGLFTDHNNCRKEGNFEDIKGLRFAFTWLLILLIPSCVECQLRGIFRVMGYAVTASKQAGFHSMINKQYHK